jgi:FkbM family methyltransferase
MSCTHVMGNITRLAVTPGMPGAYLNWLWSTRVRNVTPAVACVNTKIRGWASFSDYWCFRKGIEAAERKLIDRTLHDYGSVDPIAFDIGAHVGLFSAELAGRGFREVHAFEPTPITFERLRRNIQSSPSTRGIVRLNPVAVGAESGFVSFAAEAGSPGTNHVVVATEHAPSEHGVSTELAVPMTTLDQYCGERGIHHIEFLKIDAEGFEPFVLEGGRNTLGKKRVRVMLLELCPDVLQRAGTSGEELFAALASLCYSAHQLEHDGTPGRRLERDDFRKTKWANVLAIPC